MWERFCCCLTGKRAGRLLPRSVPEAEAMRFSSAVPTAFGYFCHDIILLPLCSSWAIPHKERLATLHAICLQISLQSLFRIFPHASCVHIFRDISGKYSKIHKGFSPFFPSSLKKSDDAICIRQIRNRLSYFAKMLVNTSSIHSAFVSSDEKFDDASVAQSLCGIALEHT